MHVVGVNTMHSVCIKALVDSNVARDSFDCPNRKYNLVTSDPTIILLKNHVIFETEKLIVKMLARGKVIAQIGLRVQFAIA